MLQMGQKEEMGLPPTQSLDSVRERILKERLGTL